MERMSFSWPSICLAFLLAFAPIESSDGFVGAGAKTSLIFSTVGRSRYDFDIFTLPVPSSLRADDNGAELLLTDGKSINYNGFFPSSSSLQSLISGADDSVEALVYVSERNGTSNIYLNARRSGNGNRRSTLDSLATLSTPLLRLEPESLLSQRDRPSISGNHLIYVSTHEDSGIPRMGWAAVYSTHIPSGKTKRLTPKGTVDFSPSVSPSGEWTAVASSAEGSYSGETGDLFTQITLFRTVDGSDRTIVIDHGGWPCWGDDSTLYFHRKSDDGWWSIFKASLSQNFSVVAVDRITPPGFHAFTPATGNGFLVMATRRSSSAFRHIEMLDLATGDFIEITSPVSPRAHHFNPFVSPDSSKIGYHRCRGGARALSLEHMQSPYPDISLFRIDGHFPSFSPDGRRIAYVEMPGLFVMNADGSGKQKISEESVFPTAWDWKRESVIYTSRGPSFDTSSTEVDVVSISLKEDELGSLSPTIKKLTHNAQNNAFPSPSPDGRSLVFRSGRSGYKNLYIMDAVEGEEAGIRQLTSGPWTDTMPTWSPDGDWIAFSSNRELPGSSNFSLYLIHPNGTGLKSVVVSGVGGRVNHACFSPDSKRIAFGADYAGVSAEVVSTPNSVLPYGEIFVANIDGSDVRRLTHNAYEDGTPAWGPRFLEPYDVEELLAADSRCQFDDQDFLAPPESLANKGICLKSS